MSAKSRSCRGAALVEVLITIVLSSLLIGLFLHADLTVNRSIIRWVKRSGLEQAALNLTNQLRRDINRCDSLLVQSPKEIEMFSSGNAVTRYSFADSTVTRNGRALLPLSISIAGFSLSPLLTDLEGATSRRGSVEYNQQVLTITLARTGLATQTIVLPIRPYAKRHIE